MGTCRYRFDVGYLEGRPRPGLTPAKSIAKNEDVEERIIITKISLQKKKLRGAQFMNSKQYKITTTKLITRTKPKQKESNKRKTEFIHI